MPANPYQPPQTEPRSLPPRGETIRIPTPWLAAVALLGLALGAVSRLSRPYFDFGMHWDALISLALLFLISAALLIRCYRIRFRPVIASGYYQTGLVSLWTTFVIGWSLIHGSIFDDLLQVCAMCWIGSALFGLIILALTRNA